MIATRFEELEAWQLADELKKKIYDLVESTSARGDRKFREQITEAAASATSNLSEGFGYFRHPEFAKYARTAKASLIETQNHLGDGVDRRHWTRAAAAPLYELADRAIGKCVRLVEYLETTPTPKRKQTRRRSS